MNNELISFRQRFGMSRHTLQINNARMELSNWSVTHPLQVQIEMTHDHSRKPPWAKISLWWHHNLTYNDVNFHKLLVVQVNLYPRNTMLQSELTCRELRGEDVQEYNSLYNSVTYEVHQRKGHNKNQAVS